MAYVLIVDDDEDFSSAVATVVKAAGHQVEVQLSTKAGMESVQKKRPDLIILDVMFPENDSAGFEFARKFQKANDGLKKIPILMLTAINKRSQVGFSERDIDNDWLPVDDFVEKPVDFNLLLTKVQNLLEKYGPR